MSSALLPHEPMSAKGEPKREGQHLRNATPHVKRASRDHGKISVTRRRVRADGLDAISDLVHVHDCRALEKHIVIEFASLRTALLCALIVDFVLFRLAWCAR